MTATLVVRNAVASHRGRARLNRRRILLGSAIGLGAAIGLTACDIGSGKPKFNHIDITGANFARDFALTGADGKPHRLADLKGKLVVVFFGFTQCPDVCPTTLSDMTNVMKQLGTDAKRVQVVFVTLDPERDTPAVMAPYVAAFDPSFLGLYGTLEETKKVATEFKVIFEKVPGKSASSYTIDHTAASYVFDTNGKIRLFVKHGQPVQWLAADLKTLLAQS